MRKHIVIALALVTGGALSGTALAEPAEFDGTWSVSLVSSRVACAAAGLVRRFMVQNGSVRAAARA